MLGLGLQGSTLVACVQVEEGMRCLDEAMAAAARAARWGPEELARAGGGESEDRDGDRPGNGAGGLAADRELKAATRAAWALLTARKHAA